jgi:hypothetical protein
MAASGIAGAAGGGYGPSGAVPSAVPGGFTSVVIAKTLTSEGGKVHVSLDGFSVMAIVPKGALPGGGQVAFTRAKDAALKKGLSGSLRGDNVVIAVGFVLDRNGRALKSKMPIDIKITGSDLKVGDIIVDYRDGKFVKIGTVTIAGQATIDPSGVTELAILT